jgi:anti-sigma-K factor RskA
LGRRSRKRRKTTPAGTHPAPEARRPTPSATATAEKPPSRSEIAEKPPSRSEQRNAEARAKLEPLAPGERPGAVTVAAVVALVLGVGNLIAYAAGLTIEGKRP